MAKKFCPIHPENPLWAKGRCIVCYRNQYARPLKKTRLKPISEKHKNMLSVYRLLRAKKLRLDPRCEIGTDKCTRIATEVHHSGKKFSTRLWLDITKFVSSCHNCHRAVEDSPNLARELGIYNYKTTNEKDYDADDSPDFEFIGVIKQQEEDFQEGSIY